MKTLLRPALTMLVVLTLLTGIGYPLVVTGLARVLLPWQADGSLITEGGRVVGSLRIGQAFSDPRYFWGRPSATAPLPYNGVGSGGSNLGPANPALAAEVAARIARLAAAGPVPSGPVPVDLVTASASGLDPEISLAAAYYQAPRIAWRRQLPLAAVRALIRRETVAPTWGWLGESRVNVLRLNLALDRLHPE